MSDTKAMEVPEAKDQADPHVSGPAELVILQHCARAPLHQLSQEVISFHPL